MTYQCKHCEASCLAKWNYNSVVGNVSFGHFSRQQFCLRQLKLFLVDRISGPFYVWTQWVKLRGQTKIVLYCFNLYYMFVTAFCLCLLFGWSAFLLLLHLYVFPLILNYHAMWKTQPFSNKCHFRTFQTHNTVILRPFCDDLKLC